MARSRLPNALHFGRCDLSHCPQCGRTTQLLRCVHCNTNSFYRPVRPRKPTDAEREAAAAAVVAEEVAGRRQAARSEALVRQRLRRASGSRDRCPCRLCVTASVAASARSRVQDAEARERRAAEAWMLERREERARRAAAVAEAFCYDMLRSDMRREEPPPPPTPASSSSSVRSADAWSGGEEEEEAAGWRRRAADAFEARWAAVDDITLEEAPASPPQPVPWVEPPPPPPPPPPPQPPPQPVPWVEPPPPQPVPWVEPPPPQPPPPPPPFPAALWEEAAYEPPPPALRAALLELAAAEDAERAAMSHLLLSDIAKRAAARHGLRPRAPPPRPSPALAALAKTEESGRSVLSSYLLAELKRAAEGPQPPPRGPPPRSAPRSRVSTAALAELEAQLARLQGSRVVTPQVSAAQWRSWAGGQRDTHAEHAARRRRRAASAAEQQHSAAERRRREEAAFADTLRGGAAAAARGAARRPQPDCRGCAPYAVLGVVPGADAADVKRAYRKLAMQWHPDRAATADAAERFKHIANAHQMLSSPTRRKKHDAAHPCVCGGASRARGREW